MLRWIKQRLKKEKAAHLQSGCWGERQAVRLLRKKRYKIRGKNVRVGRHDELDIVAEQRGVIVFVEVKTRRNENFGRPITADNRENRKRLSRAAVNYLRDRKLQPDHIRFDVIEVIGQPDGVTPEIRHIENAFPLDSAYRLWW
jgi:putative endonuclease